MTTDNDILNALLISNIEDQKFPWCLNTPSGITKRWNLPIPVKDNGDDRARIAMDKLESRLGITLFDRLSIQLTPNVHITKGIVFSQGTAFIPPTETNLNACCANVAAGPNVGNYPSNFFDRTTGVIDTVLYVNLDNEGCIASGDIVIHELGHAIGLGPHFEGFGLGAPISGLFYLSLKTLYSNQPGTAAKNLTVTR